MKNKKHIPDFSQNQLLIREREREREREENPKIFITNLPITFLFHFFIISIFNLFDPPKKIPP